MTSGRAGIEPASSSDFRHSPTEPRPTLAALAIELAFHALPKEGSNLHRLVQSQVSYQIRRSGKREHPVTGVKGCSRGAGQGWEVPGEERQPACLHHPGTETGVPESYRRRVAQVGACGLASRVMPAPCGVRSPLRWLHGSHEATVLVQAFRPPLEVGTTWSTVKPSRLPQ